MFFKTSLQPMALPDGVERFDFNGCTYVTSVDGRPFIERTTADDEDVNFTMCVAPPPTHTHTFPLLTLHLQGVRFTHDSDDAGAKGLRLSNWAKNWS